jgi:hypothetical protein
MPFSMVGSTLLNIALLLPFEQLGNQGDLRPALGKGVQADAEDMLKANVTLPESYFSAPCQVVAISSASLFIF